MSLETELLGRSYTTYY